MEEKPASGNRRCPLRSAALGFGMDHSRHGIGQSNNEPPRSPANHTRPFVSVNHNSLIHCVLRRFLKPLKRVKEINRTHKPNPLIPLQSQQIEVARDNEVRFAGKSTGKDVVIVRVFLDDVRRSGIRNNFSYANESLYSCSKTAFLPPKIFSENSCNFAYDMKRYEKFIRAFSRMSPYLNQQGIWPVEYGNINVGIKNDPKSYFPSSIAIVLVPHI
jgi:hypothetical protein